MFGNGGVFSFIEWEHEIGANTNAAKTFMKFFSFYFRMFALESDSSIRCSAFDPFEVTGKN